ncbi:hypothetical protein COY90_05225 [Candidatus Roizmanbacteria bacterium CG_4_10_14_0_8_um_filter_39_9]|uniref:Transposase IS200-like domain-containing protein n=1 Tax=Candidatus Roizmanbacteria bacterium CG_4_10_14_0_8_um_filter_39_9 TaxID=1974829 RepID=A0A2M7QCB7_9BACT|nr:MAG: hypothetical protein COY90_05225 [Candidatus Roizmanbacteria bacterium CG_4_10_14_0_8_um_filter_39_9]
MGIWLLAHTAYRYQYHIVFVTKYRHKTLNPAKFRSVVEQAIKSSVDLINRNEITWLENLYNNTKSMWTVGYFVLPVGIDETIIRRYVKYQQEQDSGQAKPKFHQ